MPRTGITLNEVLQACEALEARAESVTQVNVRKELGDTGSYGSIRQGIATWRARKGSTPQAPSFPIPDSVQALFVSTWAAACAEALAENRRDREVWAAKEASIRAEMASMMEEHAKVVEDLEGRSEDQCRLIAELGEKVEASQARIEDLVGTVGYLKGQAEGLEAREIVLKDQVEALLAENLSLEAERREVWMGIRAQNCERHHGWEDHHVAANSEGERPNFGA